MKVKAQIKVFDEERVLEVPCGLGDKSFKWLAMVACQRFALTAPNGSLRRREELRGATEHAQHLPFEIYLENGDMPHPDGHIANFVRDGDTVYISLQDAQNVAKTTNSPVKTKWAATAFSHSDAEGSYEAEEEGDLDNEGETEEAIQARAAKAGFMRVMLKSQMLDHRKIESRIEEEWTRSVVPGMPLLKAEESRGIRAVLRANFDIVTELFNSLSSNGQLNAEGFYQICEAIQLFDSKDIAKLSRRNFDKVQASTRAQNPHYMDFGNFLVLLILSAQSRFHDTFNKTVKTLSCVEAFEEMFAKCIRPWAQRVGAVAYLKEEFSKDSFLGTIRDWSEDLFKLFQKHAAKSKDIPSSVTPEHMTDLLAEAKLQPAGAVAATRELLIAVRSGSLVGRDPRNEDENAKNEFLFPEFVEALARMGYMKYNIDGSVPTETLFLKGLRAGLDAKPEVVTNTNSRK